jgi:predicted AlkP superfamily phosphohydrolase/phosphomutase
MSRILLIGLDGAEPSLVEPWMDEGHLPNLARLRQTGAYFPVASTVPPATFPAWTTCVTGLNPGRHGVFDFTEMVPGRYAIQFVNSTFRKAPALWNVLSEAGKRVGILGVPTTYPPEPVNGFMVAGFDSPVATSIDRSFVYPADLYESVERWRFADFQESSIGPGWHEAALPKLLRKIEDKQSIAIDLLRGKPWDFFMVVFSESDTVAHHFWPFHDPKSPRHQPGFEDAILQVYQALDGGVGALIEAAGEGAMVLIVSDHGFGGAGTGVVHLNNWLSERGHLCFASQADSLLKRAALKATPQQWRGPLFRRFRGLASRAESKSRFAGIDWPNTRAWSEELNYFPSVRVNLEGREPQGRVSLHEYPSFCERLCGELESWEPVKKAWRREELYQGEHVDKAPDIILELNLEDSYSYSCLRSRGGPALRRMRPDEYPGGKEKGMAGTHRPNGILFLSKPTPASYGRLEDVAPTVLAELGVPGPPMDGVSLLDAGPAPCVEAQPKPQTERSYSEQENRILEERLRDLGYFE